MCPKSSFSCTSLTYVKDLRSHLEYFVSNESRKYGFAQPQINYTAPCGKPGQCSQFAITRVTPLGRRLGKSTTPRQCHNSQMNYRYIPGSLQIFLTILFMQFGKCHNDVGIFPYNGRPDDGVC